MAVITIYRLAEQTMNLLEGGARNAAASISMNEIKIACGQVINKMLKVDYLTINTKMGEAIPNGTVLGLYEDIEVTSWNNRSKAILPIKPIKLPRNMGVWGIYPKFTTNGFYDFDKEFIPLQAGQAALIKSQRQINELLGQYGYEVFSDAAVFNLDLKALFPQIKLAMRLAIMDISQYGDYDILPLMPEMEWDVIKEVYQLYSTQPLPDKLVDPTVNESNNIPLTQQKQM